MEYQFVSEVRSFWNILFLPTFLGVVSIILICWIIGDKFKERIYDFFLLENQDDYVLQNGIFLPRKLTKAARFKNKFIEYTGKKHLWSIIFIFLIVVLMFGTYEIITRIFSPRLIRNSFIILSCGIDDYSLAFLWRKLKLESINDLYLYVVQNSDGYSVSVFLRALESYLRFWSCILTIILFFPHKKHIKRGRSNYPLTDKYYYENINQNSEEISKIEKRYIRRRIAVAFIIISFILLIVYALQIREDNKNFRSRFYTVFTNENAASYKDNDELEVFYEKVQNAKKNYNESSNKISFRIRSEIYDSIKFFTSEIASYCKEKNILLY